jgi:BlaI family transcriptional regulator, penicillinase repressor
MLFHLTICLVKIHGTMQKLTNKEEEVMIILWRLKKAFVKELMAEIEGDKPHYNTLSTIVRHLEEKKYVAYEAFGNTHRYYPLVSLEDYRKRFVNSKMVEYFDNSYKSMVSFFAKEEKISVDELKEIIELIEKKK